MKIKNKLRPNKGREIRNGGNLDGKKILWSKIPSHQPIMTLDSPLVSIIFVGL